MNDQQIINYAIKEEVCPVLVDGAYEVVKRGRFASWVIGQLLKRGWIKPHFKEEVEYKSIVIDKKKVFDLIQEQLDYLWERGEKPTTLLIGRKAMRDLQQELNHSLDFKMQLELYSAGQLKLLGLEAKVLPYIDGVVLF